MNITAEQIKVTQEIVEELNQNKKINEISPKSIFSHKKWKL